MGGALQPWGIPALNMKPCLVLARAELCVRMPQCCHHSGYIPSDGVC